MVPLVRAFGSKVPRLGERVYLAETAVVVGDVVLAEDVNIWFGSVLRGDVGWIRIGARSNVQDLSMVHMTTSISNTEIAEDVSVGHGVIIHGAKIESGALIGMGSILLDNAVIGEEALVAAGSLVTGRTEVPPRTLVRGSPARVVRELTPEECLQGRLTAERYLGLAREHHAAAR